MCVPKQNTKGVGLVEVLVSLTILSTVMLACLSYSLYCMKLSQNSLWDTVTISCFASFFERMQLDTGLLFDDSQLVDYELSALNRALKNSAPLTNAKIESDHGEIKLVMTRDDNRNVLRVATVEAII